MSFLGGPECSTGANPLAQFHKKTSADTSLQRDRLTSRTPLQLNNFRTQPGLPQDAAFENFAQSRAQFGETLPADTFHLEQLRQQQRSGGPGMRPGGAWSGEFAQQGSPHFAPEEFAKQRNGANFSPTDFANFRQSQWTPTQRSGSPLAQAQTYQQQPAFAQSFGGGFGMQMPMMYQSQFPAQVPQQQQYEGKGKGRVQELSDTDWEKQFEALSASDKEADALDREAEAAIERELDQMDK